MGGSLEERFWRRNVSVLRHNLRKAFWISNPSAKHFLLAAQRIFLEKERFKRRSVFGEETFMKSVSGKLF
jgi:hypothetical protein